MTIGITNFNSKATFTNNLSIGSSEQIKIDQYGNIITSGNMDISGKLNCTSDLTITNISSTNSSISVDTSGNCLLNGTIYTKDIGSFTNNLYLRNKNNQIIFNISSENNSYLNISPVDQKIGFGTITPKHFFHVAGEVYNENTIINKNLIINPDNLLNQNTEAYGLSVGGNINITGGVYINGVEFLPGKLQSLANQLSNNISSGSGTISTSGTSSFISGNDLDNGVITINGVKLSTWTSINSVLYYTEGNVGIGTKNPIYPFEVNGNTSIRGNVIYLYGEVYYNDKLLDEIVTGLWDTNTDNSFLIYTAFNTNSKVGIGIKEPKYKLDLIGDFHVTENIVADKNIFINNNLGIGTNDPQYKLDVNGDLRVSGDFYINGKKYVETETQNIFWMETVNTNNIYYLNKVGIQVTNPKYDLHVKGSFYIDGNSFLNGPTGMTELNIENKFSFNSDKLIIKNTTGDMFSKGIIYSNNIHGDLSSSTKLFQNNELFMTITPNSKIFQLKRSFSDGFKGVGITTNGMVFSNNGNLFACVVPYGTHNKSNGDVLYNGVVQTYEWDNISKVWHPMDNISSALLDRSSPTSYSTSVACNNDGNFIAVSSHTKVDYKVIFYLLDEDKKWNFINYIEVLNDDEAGKYMIMEPNVKYLFLSEKLDNIELYVNENPDTASNYDANFKKGTFNLSKNNNIGKINDLKCNNECNIIVTSSYTGANPSVANNGTIACYAFWNSTGNPSILSATPFIRLGKNIQEYESLTNVDSKRQSYFGIVCDIASHSNIDFKDGVVNSFEYDITIAVGTGGLYDAHNTPSFIKIYKFKYRTENTTSGLVYPPAESSDTLPYIDGTWEEIGHIDHVTYNSEVGFGADIKLNNDGTILIIGSPIENNILIMNYNATNKSWNVINKIQGIKSSDTSLGYKLCYNYLNSNFAASSFHYAISDVSEVNNSDYLGVSSEYNHIRMFTIEYNNASSTF